MNFSYDFVPYTKKIEAVGKGLPYPLPSKSASNLMMEAFYWIHFFFSHLQSEAGPHDGSTFIQPVFLKVTLSLQQNTQRLALGYGISVRVFLIQSLPLVNHESIQWFL